LVVWSLTYLALHTFVRRGALLRLCDLLYRHTNSHEARLDRFVLLLPSSSPATIPSCAFRLLPFPFSPSLKTLALSKVNRYCIAQFIRSSRHCLSNNCHHEVRIDCWPCGLCPPLTAGCWYGQLGRCTKLFKSFQLQQYLYYRSEEWV